MYLLKIDEPGWSTEAQSADRRTGPCSPPARRECGESTDIILRKDELDPSVDSPWPSATSLCSERFMSETSDQKFISNYPALRRMARHRLRQHETVTLLGTTALVHESFLRMSQAADLKNSDTPAFLAYAGRVMRSVIVDAARSRLTLRRGEGNKAEALDDEIAELISDAPAKVIVDLHEALLTLEQAEPRLAQVISLLYFGGMTDAEVATTLGLSDRTVRRDAERARVMLKALLA